MHLALMEILLYIRITDILGLYILRSKFKS